MTTYHRILAQADACIDGLVTPPRRRDRDAGISGTARVLMRLVLLVTILGWIAGGLYRAGVL
jgi:hypothetical protein